MSEGFDAILPKATQPFWAALCEEARIAAAKEPALASLMAAAILSQRSLGAALSFRLAGKLADHDLGAEALRQGIDDAYRGDPSIVETAERDHRAVVERDPASTGHVTPFLFFKGFLALQAHRVAHWHHGQGRGALAFHLQSRSSAVFHVDIHPAARMGRGVFIDHGTGVVIGRGARVGDDVSILQGVTLGGDGPGDGHPKIGAGVQLFAGAKVLGGVSVGDHAKIAAGSVVIRDVPAGCTAVGAPARLVNCPAGTLAD